MGEHLSVVIAYFLPGVAEVWAIAKTITAWKNSLNKIKITDAITVVPYSLYDVGL